jgi:hypothetical membrane protein
MLKVNPMDKWRIWLGGFCGIVSPILTLIMVIASTIISPWFSWDTHALSQLGEGEVSLLFNSAVIVGGTLNLLFTFGIREYLPKEKLAKTGVTLIILGNICLVLVGIFTVSYPIMHGIVALGEFTLGPIGIILLGLSSKENRIKKISITNGTAALISILILPAVFLALPIKVGFAVPEIIEALIVSAWIIYMGNKMLSC